METEIWKKIKGFENYEVSNLGRVRRNECTIIYKNGNIAKYKLKYLTLENNKGNKLGFYKRVTICVNNKPKKFFVHRLVAECFIPNNNNKKCVNHIDGNPSNNIFNNLEWCTHKENEIHSYNILGKINGNRKLSDLDVKIIRNDFCNGLNSAKHLSKKFNVSIRTIYNVVKNKYYVTTA